MSATSIWPKTPWLTVPKRPQIVFDPGFVDIDDYVLTPGKIWAINPGPMLNGVIGFIESPCRIHISPRSFRRHHARRPRLPEVVKPERMRMFDR